MNMVGQVFQISALIVAAIGASSVSLEALAATPSAPPVICIDNTCATTEINPPSSDGVRWHPGHYVAISGFIFDSAWMSSFHSQVDSFCSNKYIKGVQLTKSWAALEGSTQGDYSKGFGYVDQVLTKLRSCNKHLILKVAEREFGSPHTGTPTPSGLSWMFPTYITTNSAYGGSSQPYGVVYSPANVSWTGSLKTVARFWEAPVMDRLIALSKAYGGRYNSNPNFEMISLEETAVSAPLQTGYTSSAHDAQLRRWLAATSAAFSKAQVRIMANYLNNANNLFAYCASLPNCNVGGPDPELPLPDITRSITANRVFRGLDGGSDRRGTIPWVGEQQGLGLTVRILEEPAAIQKYQNETMHASYMVWTKNEAWSMVLNQINVSAGTIYRSGCPASFGACTTN